MNEWKKKSLVEVFKNTFHKVEIMSRQCLNYCPYSFDPGIEVLDLYHDGEM